MASPYLVSKRTVPKDSKGFETCTSGSTRFLSPVQCGVNCSQWCAVCAKCLQYKDKLFTPKVSLRKQFSDESIESSCYECLNQDNSNIQYNYEKVGKAKESIKKFQPKLQETKSNPQSEFVIPNNRHINTIKGKNWCPNVNKGTCESYFKEVESLRKSLIELSACSRKLPMLPTEKDTNVSKSANGIRSKTQNSMSYECEKGKQTIVNSDCKRLRHLSDSENCVVVNNSVAPKRFRDHSPLILGKGDSERIVNDLMASNYSNGGVIPDQINTSQISQNNGIHLKQNNKIKHNNMPNNANLKNTEKVVDSHDIELYNDGGVQGTASSSPSYAVGDTLEKISLDDLQTELTSSLTHCSGLRVTDVIHHPFLRPSLFSHVPPYVKFYSHEQKVNKPLPRSIQKILKWKLSTITPIVVRQTVVNSGFKLVRRSTDWGGIWGRHMKSICFKTLKENQKINHIPGTFQIGRKDRLWKNLYRFMTKFGKKEFGFIPRTYVLPQDTKLLRGAFDKAGAKNKWIVKPPASARGSGIKVIHKWGQIPKKIPVVVQKYISNPYLINGNKFDLRLYVLVTSFNPLRVYLYDNGLVRFASVKYSEENSTLTNRFMHLTNYSINKLSNNYAQNEDAEACEGHKWTIRSLWSYLEETVNTDTLWKNLIELVIKTMISGESVISQMTKANLNSRYSAYELFGVDVLLDENLKPWLLEVNISPSLHSASPLDLAVKSPMVTDLLNIAGYHIPNMLRADQAKQIGKKIGINSDLLFDHRMYVVGLSPKEKIKQSAFCKLEHREFYLDAIINDLSPDDVRHLIVYEDELTQLGNFQKIFPTSSTFSYFQYLEGNLYYNMLFDAWETKYHNRRIEGIKVLEEKCRLQIHLDISLVEHRQSMICAPDTPTSPFEESLSGSDSANTDTENRTNSIDNDDEPKE